MLTVGCVMKKSNSQNCHFNWYNLLKTILIKFIEVSTYADQMYALHELLTFLIKSLYHEDSLAYVSVLILFV